MPAFLAYRSTLGTNVTTVYGKYVWVEKSNEELLLDETEFGHGAIFPVNALTENSMVVSLVEGGLEGVRGKVEYAKELYE